MGFSGGLSKENRRRHSLDSGAIYQLILSGSIDAPAETTVVQGLKRSMDHHRIAAPIKGPFAATQRTANSVASRRQAGGCHHHRGNHDHVPRILTSA